MTTPSTDNPSRSAPASPISEASLANVGWEIELLAPPGESRRSLAERLAQQFAGSVNRIFHGDTELTRVEGKRVFHHLSLGFDVFDSEGVHRCRLVDDITIIDDLDGGAPPADGWYRLLSDDRRLMNLAYQVCDPAAEADTVLEPLAALFGSEPASHRAGVTTLDDRDGATIGAVALQGGERERVCEVIMPPIAHDHAAALGSVLDTARDMGFRVPAEAAVHAHFDAAPFRSTPALARLVEVFSTDREALLDELGTNRKCRRIGPLRPALVEEVNKPGFAQRPWTEVQPWFASLDPPKYADVNLRAIAGRRSAVDTLEVRILPGSVDAERIVAKTELLTRRLSAAAK
jgi:hypothetical protein